MCNAFRRRVAVGEIADVCAELRIPLRFPEGVPNLAPLDSNWLFGAGPGPDFRQTRPQHAFR